MKITFGDFDIEKIQSCTPRIDEILLMTTKKEFKYNNLSEKNEILMELTNCQQKMQKIGKDQKKVKQRKYSKKLRKYIIKNGIQKTNECQYKKINILKK